MMTLKDYLNPPTATMLSYDMDTTDDPNINAFIKNELKAKGWHDWIIKTENQSYATKQQTSVRNLPMPESTLWKVGVTPAVAIRDFKQSLNEYNAKHPEFLACGVAYASNGTHYLAFRQEK